ncbi:peptidylprolyl isomerase [Allocoleopsis sp.]|uniref:peptidylprolyl isomerase n=1 Tax=Allocoleopsis sp. TaxID=3088169 RepID=UPI002FD2C214
MRFSKILKLDWYKRLTQTSLLALLLVTLSFGLSGAWWDSGNSQPARESRLPVGNAITDGKALLRYSLPIDNQPVRDIQASLEDISTQLRAKRWSPVGRDVTKAATILSDRAEKLLADILEEKQPQAEALIAEMNQGITSLREAVEAKDREKISILRGQLLTQVGELEEMMMGDFPFEVPSEYSNLPQLKGRATVEMTTNKGNLTVVVDGYSAPVTAGNFVDLVQRGFYNGLEFIRAEDFYVLQVGDPPGKEEGFVDPTTGEYRAIPLEVLVRGDSEPVYGITLEDAGRYRDQPVLPFSAYGTVAMARPGDDPNGGSSQFFFFLFEPELTPAGLNLLDGRYSVFGYLVQGKEVLEKLKEGDVIESAKVVKGAENLVTPQVAQGSSGQKQTATKRDEIESAKVVEEAENLVDSQVTQAIAEPEAVITPDSQPAILDTPTS